MAAAELFASPDDMERRSLGAISAATHPYLGDELAAASRLIRDFCRWHVAPVVSVTHVRRGRGRDAVWLPAMEVASVDGVKVDGLEWGPDLLERVEFDPRTGWTNIEGASVEVRFTAGFDTVPESLRSLTLQVAARALGSPLGLVREQAGSVVVTHSQVGSNQAGGVLLLPAEEAALTEYQVGRLP